MTAQGQSRKTLVFWPRFTKAQKDGSWEDVSHTVNQARPSAKLLPGPRLGQDGSARKWGSMVINQRRRDFRLVWENSWRPFWSWSDATKGNLGDMSLSVFIGSQITRKVPGISRLAKIWRSVLLNFGAKWPEIISADSAQEDLVTQAKTRGSRAKMLDRSRQKFPTRQRKMKSVKFVIRCKTMMFAAAARAPTWEINEKMWLWSSHRPWAIELCWFHANICSPCNKDIKKSTWHQTGLTPGRDAIRKYGGLIAEEAEA